MKYDFSVQTKFFIKSSKILLIDPINFEITIVFLKSGENQMLNYFYFH